MTIAVDWEVKPQTNKIEIIIGPDKIKHTA